MSTLHLKTSETWRMEEAITCPYCLQRTTVQPARDYAPIYAHCKVCGKRFIVERIVDGIQALRIEGAPTCSDPDRREIEMGMGQED